MEPLSYFGRYLFRFAFSVVLSSAILAIYEAGCGQWNTLDLRKPLEEVLPKSKEIRDFPLEATFADIGKRNLLINPFRIFDEGWDLQMILMAIEDVTGERG